MSIKKISELGISQWPWKVGGPYLVHDYCVFSDDDEDVAYGGEGAYFRNNDARLIAAAPEMYECLMEACDIACARCQTANRINCDQNFPVYKSCLPSKWRDALAKASGSELEK